MDADVIVLGTGLTQSITAAALSKAGFSVAHVDVNPYYGGDDTSLTLDELVEWADTRTHADDAAAPDAYLSAQRARYTSISCSTSALPQQSRQYSVSLAPTIIPSVGPLINSLVSSGVSRYGGFKLLEKVAIYDGPGSVKPVPGSKEDVFKNKDLSLLEKRRLMRFLMFAAGDFADKPELEGKEQMPFVQFLRETFSLDQRTTNALAYALAFCVSASDPTLPALQRVRRYLRSAGRYGTSPFLVGHYGGLGEIAQGFCRTAAVSGATYILGRRISSITSHSLEERTRKHRLKLHDLDEELKCDLIVSSSDFLLGGSLSLSDDIQMENTHAIARGIAIIDRPLSFSTTEQASSIEPPDPVDYATTDAEQLSPTREQLDTALLVLPPSSLPDGSSTVAVNILTTGEGSLSAPRGKWIVYISMPLLEETTRSAEELLRPYLDAALTLAVPNPDDSAAPLVPLFTMFYTQTPAPSMPSSDSSRSVLRVTDSLPILPEVADSATSQAEVLFWKAVELLKGAGCRPRPRKEDDGEEANEEVEIDSFWPPLDMVDDPSEDW
ncbi:hypothetical protein POSPLADRAFT_1147731 [Postia placenta MAD-698-R-SB12]|uniref:Rab proteins geranylgeranyltransferase n=1 Tax=Postia placenta MAD-698-R-SB12 TaxID=670580 RepID=A0A1X6MW88_9APHY|nr:hypothetical protein POSPLADRAFT_1147731 [Postia placenta MAD-698-R-SB12]OSX60621.1 hypothetical protein POSPLADRAFT_1147731 [Postia placenta MAD-698-R-SB12]